MKTLTRPFGRTASALGLAILTLGTTFGCNASRDRDLLAAEMGRRSAEPVAQVLDRKMLDRDAMGRPALVDDFSTQAHKASEKKRLAKRHEGFVHQATLLNSQNLLP